MEKKPKACYRFPVLRTCFCRRFGHWKSIEVCRSRMYYGCKTCPVPKEDERIFGGRVYVIVEAVTHPGLVATDVAEILDDGSTIPAELPEEYRGSSPELKSYTEDDYARLREEWMSLVQHEDVESIPKTLGETLSQAFDDLKEGGDNGRKRKKRKRSREVRAVRPRKPRSSGASKR